MSLLLEIARCPVVLGCRRLSGRISPCSAIIGAQEHAGDQFQLPEPWSGDLANAPLLFFGSNPSFAEKEEYPTPAWGDDLVADFFVNRFSGGTMLWVKDQKYPLLKDGSHTTGWVRYWASVKHRAEELLGTPNLRPGKDYVMSEVVHCKSRREIGVAQAAEECTRLYLRRIVAESGARVVVALGAFAGEAIRREFCVPAEARAFGPVLVGERLRYFAFLPHPNAYAVKTFGNCLARDELSALVSFCRGGTGDKPSDQSGL